MGDALSDFADSLATPAPDRSTVAERRAIVWELMRTADLGVWDIFESGSFTHGTAVPVSDVDYMARTSPDRRPQLPSTALHRVKDAFAGCYHVREVRVSSPAVKVTFWTPPHFEVAPAFDIDTSRADDVFVIAGPNEEWVRSAPSAHNRYVSAQNDRLGKRVKPLVRLLKAWKYHSGVPISSTYLELRTAQYAATQTSIVYGVDLAAMFDVMLSHALADMNDPLGIVQRIRPCSSEVNRHKAMAEMHRASSTLAQAEDARRGDDAATYWGRMVDLFGNTFPYRMW